MNEAAGIALIAVIFTLFTVIIIGSLVHARNVLMKTYQCLARRFDGNCRFDGLWRQRPSVTFVYKNAHAVVDIHSTGGEHPTYYTQLRIGWPDIFFRCEVYPEGTFSRVRKFFGMRDVEIGSRRFDEDYVITGPRIDQLHAFLTPVVQCAIDRLRRFHHASRSFRLDGSGSRALAGDIYISVGGGQLLIKKQGLIREYEPLEAFVLLALDLYDEATRAADEGIEFVEAKAEAKLSLKEAVCQVCGESVKLDAVFCRSCKTPHHKDCWEYYGACSTYGCGQRRYLVQRAR